MEIRTITTGEVLLAMKAPAGQTANILEAYVDDVLKWYIDKDGNISGTLTFTNLIPDGDNTRTLGDATHAWATIYLGTAAQIRSDSTIAFKNEANGAYQTIDALSLSIGGTSIVSSSRVLSNVTAAAGIITSGQFALAQMPRGTAGYVIRGAGVGADPTYAQLAFTDMATGRITLSQMTAGTSGYFLKGQGASDSIYAALALSDLPSGTGFVKGSGGAPSYVSFALSDIPSGTGFLKGTGGAPAYTSFALSDIPSGTGFLKGSGGAPAYSTISFTDMAAGRITLSQMTVGSSGYFLKGTGATDPAYSAFALSDIPSGTGFLKGSGGAPAYSSIAAGDVPNLDTNKLTTVNSASLVSGDVFYVDATPRIARLAKGTDGKVLQLVSGFPSWETVSGTGDVVGPAGATEHSIAVYGSATGKLIESIAVPTSTSQYLKCASTGPPVTYEWAVPSGGTLSGPPSHEDYVVWNDSGTYKAYNVLTNTVDYSNTDFVTVIEAIFASNTNACVFLRPGSYTAASSITLVNYDGGSITGAGRNATIISAGGTCSTYGIIDIRSDFFSVEHLTIVGNEGTYTGQVGISIGAIPTDSQEAKKGVLRDIEIRDCNTALKFNDQVDYWNIDHVRMMDENIHCIVLNTPTGSTYDNGHIQFFGCEMSGTHSCLERPPGGAATFHRVYFYACDFHDAHLDSYMVNMNLIHECVLDCCTLEAGDGNGNGPGTAHVNLWGYGSGIVNCAFSFKDNTDNSYSAVVADAAYDPYAFYGNTFANQLVSHNAIIVGDGVQFAGLEGTYFNNCAGTKYGTNVKGSLYTTYGTSTPSPKFNGDVVTWEDQTPSPYQRYTIAKINGVDYRSRMTVDGRQVEGPALSTDTAVAIYDDTTGMLIKNSLVTINESTGAITIDGNLALSKPDGSTSKYARADGTWQTVTGGSLNGPADSFKWIVWNDAGTYKAYNTITNTLDYSNANFATMMANIMVGHTTILVAAGTYVVSSTISVLGATNHLGRICGASEGSVTFQASTGLTDGIIRIGADNWEIEGITFDGNNQSGCVGLRMGDKPGEGLYTALRCSVHDCTFLNFSAGTFPTCLKLDGNTYYNDYINLRMMDNNLYCIHFNDDTGGLGDNGQMLFQNCEVAANYFCVWRTANAATRHRIEFDRCGFYCGSASSTYAVDFAGINNLHVNNCDFEATSTPTTAFVGVGGQNQVFTACSLYANGIPLFKSHWGGTNSGLIFNGMQLGGSSTTTLFDINYNFTVIEPNIDVSYTGKWFISETAKRKCTIIGMPEKYTNNALFKFVDDFEGRFLNSNFWSATNCDAGATVTLATNKQAGVVRLNTTASSNNQAVLDTGGISNATWAYSTFEAVVKLDSSPTSLVYFVGLYTDANNYIGFQIDTAVSSNWYGTAKKAGTGSTVDLTVAGSTDLRFLRWWVDPTTDIVYFYVDDTRKGSLAATYVPISGLCYPRASCKTLTTAIKTFEIDRIEYTTRRT